MNQRVLLSNPAMILLPFEGVSGPHFVTLSMENPQTFGVRFFLHVMNVQTKLELPDRGAGLAFSASFDPNFCFFSTTLSLEHKVLEALRDRLQFKVSGSLSVKFGPSAAVWADLAARAGSGMVSQRIPR